MDAQEDVSDCDFPRSLRAGRFSLLLYTSTQQACRGHDIILGVKKALPGVNGSSHQLHSEE